MTGDLSVGGFTLATGTISRGGNMIFQRTSTCRLQIGIAYTGSASSVEIGANCVLFPVQATTGSPPAYVNGGLYFATDTDKLYVGGAAGWEAVTSA